MEWYRRAVWALSFIFNTLHPGGDSPVLSAVIANWFCSLFLLVARHKSKCLSGPQYSRQDVCVCVCVQRVMGIVRVLFVLGECQQLIQPLICRPPLPDPQSQFNWDSSFMIGLKSTKRIILVPDVFWHRFPLPIYSSWFKISIYRTIFTIYILNIQFASLVFNGVQSKNFTFLVHHKISFNYVKSCIYFTENV